jgi:GTP-binding protein
MDLKFVHWLGTKEIPFALVFTKVDKQAAQHTRNAIEKFKQAMAKSTDAQPPIFATSTTTKTGRSELLAFIAQSLTTHKQTNPFTAPRMMSETSRETVVDPEDGDELE